MNWMLLKNSVLAAGSATILALALGFFASLFAAACSRKIQKVFLVSALLVLALPPFLVTNTWMHYFGLTGVWRRYFDWNIYSLGGTVLLLALSLWPISFLLFSSALKNISRAQFESDPALRRWNLVRWIILPALKNVAAVAAAATFVLAFNNFTIPSLLQVKVYPAELWLKFNVNFNYIEALKLSWPMIAGPLCLLLLIREKRFNFFKGLPLDAGVIRDRLGSNWMVVSGLITIGTLFFSALLPLAQLATSARTFAEITPAFIAGQPALLNSLTIAFAAGLVTLLLAMITHRLRPVGAITWTLYLAPGILLGIALVFIFNRPAATVFYQSLGLVILGLALRYMAPVWSGWKLAQASIPAKWNETMHLNGGSPWQTFRYLHLPALHPQMFALFFIAYVFCLWDVETLIFFVPAGKETLSIRIFNMLHYGHATQVNALCVIMLAAALLPLAVYGAGQKILQSKKFAAALWPLLLIPAAGCSSEPKPGAEIKSEFFSNLQIVGARGTGAGQFNKPRSVIVDKDQNLFVMDVTGRMQKFTPDLKYSMVWQMPETDIGKPKGMTLDEEGNVVLVEPHYNRVNHFTSNGKLLHQWGEESRQPGGFVFPRAIAIAKNGDSFLSEYGLAERIQKFSKLGEKFLISFGEPGTGPGQFNRVEGIGMDDQNRIYAADSCNHRIQVFSGEGKLLTMFGKPGSGLGELSYPYDVRIDREGYKFVCEFGNSRIQIFGPENQPLEIIGDIGSEPGKFFNPWSIALDEAGNLYVADSGNHRVQVFTRKKHDTKARPAEATARKETAPVTRSKPGRS